MLSNKSRCMVRNLFDFNKIFNSHSCVYFSTYFSWLQSLKSIKINNPVYCLNLNCEQKWQFKDKKHHVIIFASYEIYLELLFTYLDHSHYIAYS
ncbi:unnamed protein product [Rotaria socialis]